MSKRTVSKRETLAALKATGIVAVIRTNSPNDLVAVSRALSEGGVQFVEITLTVPDAIEIIRDATAKLRDTSVFVGAGTVLDAVTAQAAINAGAQFIVGPGFDPETVKLCNTRDIAVMPGAFTPSEILNAWKGGADIVKVFPAENAGGPSYFKTIKEPLPAIELLPTKGVDLQTVGAYFKAGAFAVGVGRALLSEAMIATKDYVGITASAAKFTRTIREAKGAIQ